MPRQRIKNDSVPLQAKSRNVAVTAWLTPSELARLDRFRAAVPVGGWTEVYSRGKAMRYLMLRNLPAPPAPVLPIRPTCTRAVGCVLAPGHDGACNDAF